MGVFLAIDDFGTGFSSLSYLAKLPVHTLKIDRSFISDLTTGPEAIALVSTIIKLGHSMNLNVVAEGVETEQQSRLLRLLKCDEIQGYLSSMPMSSKIFEARYLLSPQTLRSSADCAAASPAEMPHRCAFSCRYRSPRRRAPNSSRSATWGAPSINRQIVRASATAAHGAVTVTRPDAMAARSTPL